MPPLIYRSLLNSRAVVRLPSLPSNSAYFSHPLILYHLSSPVILLFLHPDPDPSLLIVIIFCLQFIHSDHVGIPSLLGKKRTLTPPEILLDFETIDKQIQAELTLLRPLVEEFLEAPELPTWDPPNNFASDIKKFIKGLQIPTYANGEPGLLFHKLDECDDKEITEIFAPATHMYVIITALNFFSCATAGVFAIHPGRVKPGASWRA